LGNYSLNCPISGDDNLSLVLSLLPVGVPQTGRHPYGWASVHGWQVSPKGTQRRVKNTRLEQETEEECLLRFMKIPPKRKLEWLRQMK
jgi:hypothetical protein